MPEVIAHALPWLTIDRRRIYARRQHGRPGDAASSRASSSLARGRLLDSLVDFAHQYRQFPRLACTAACRPARHNPRLRAATAGAKEVGGDPRRGGAAFAVGARFVCTRATRARASRFRSGGAVVTESSSILIDSQVACSRSCVAGTRWRRSKASRGVRYIPQKCVRAHVCPMRLLRCANAPSV